MIIVNMKDVQGKVWGVISFQHNFETNEWEAYRTVVDIPHSNTIASRKTIAELIDFIRKTYHNSQLTIEIFPDLDPEKMIPAFK